MQRSVSYNFLFAGAVCVVCAVFVSASAVGLKERQEENATLDRQRNVLVAAGLAGDDERLTRAQIEERFAPIQAVVIDTVSGAELPDVDPLTFDQRRRSTNPETSRPASSNLALVVRVPDQALVYKKLTESGETELVILPVEGKGLWSTLYGFLALDADLETIRGLTFYEHKETPGLGGEVDNPKWKALWPGRRAFDENLEPRIEVIKGMAGPPDADPHRVDGLSGATITSRGVTNLLRFWLGEQGFGPYLERWRAERTS